MKRRRFTRFIGDILIFAGAALFMLGEKYWYVSSGWWGGYVVRHEWLSAVGVILIMAGALLTRWLNGKKEVRAS